MGVMQPAPGLCSRGRQLASYYRWRRPKCNFPQFEALCALWDQLPIGEWRTLVTHSKRDGNMSLADIDCYRSCFKRVANRYNLFAGAQYSTRATGRTIEILKLTAERGVPAIDQAEAKDLASKYGAEWRYR